LLSSPRPAVTPIGIHSRRSASAANAAAAEDHRPEEVVGFAVTNKWPAAGPIGVEAAAAAARVCRGPRAAEFPRAQRRKEHQPDGESVGRIRMAATESPNTAVSTRIRNGVSGGWSS